MALVFDGSSIKLKVKSKAAGEDAWFWAARKGSSYVFDFGLGDEEYGENDVPRPMRRLIATRGGGPEGNSTTFPKVLLVKGYSKRTYAEYASMPPCGDQEVNGPRDICRGVSIRNWRTCACA